MSKRFWVACAILATVLPNTGCITYCHKGFQKTLEHGAEYDVSSACRNRVHVFMIHGLTPSTDCGLDALRLKLGDNGFAKVGMGELYGALWVKSEMDCIRHNDPDARFVLLGYDLGAATAIALARDLNDKCSPVDALVLLDPVGCPAEPCGTPTLLITRAKASSRVPFSSKVIVPDASHFGLPTHPTTVTAITDLLNNIALQYCYPTVEELPTWMPSHAPDMRRGPAPKLNPEWDFLADRPGPTRAINTQVVAQPTTTTVPTTSAGPVVLKR